MCLAFSAVRFCLLSLPLARLELLLRTPLPDNRTDKYDAGFPFYCVLEQNPGHDYLDSAGYNVFTQTNQRFS